MDYVGKLSNNFRKKKDLISFKAKQTVFNEKRFQINKKIED